MSLMFLRLAGLGAVTGAVWLGRNRSDGLLGTYDGRNRLFEGDAGTVRYSIQTTTKRLADAEETLADWERHPNHEEYEKSVTSARARVMELRARIARLHKVLESVIQDDIEQAKRYPTK